MKLLNFLFSIVLMSTLGCLTSTVYASEVRSAGRSGGDRNASTTTLQHTLNKGERRQVAKFGDHKMRERYLASDGSDRLKHNRMSEGGSAHLIDRRVAEASDGSAYRR